MDTAEEDAADDDPQRAGTPAEAGSSGADGAGNGAGTGDGGEVMAHQHRSLGGHVVDAVLHGVGGGGLIVFTDAPLLAQVAAVEDVTGKQSGTADDQKNKTIHTFLFTPFLGSLGAKLLSRFFRTSFPAGLEKKQLVDVSIAAN